jgi:putative membrane-bound dehydrogenase-like protein
MAGCSHRLRMLAMVTHWIVGPAAAEPIPSRATYAEAYGETNRAVEVDPGKDLPRSPAVEPAAALATWQVKEGFHLQLAAHEPLVRDPIALCFDERGRMFVCEMIDYPEQRDSRPHLGRVSVLEDTNGDGTYDHSRVFADDLPWPTGLIWANQQLFVIATPDIWSFRDVSGDGVADVREKVFSGFGTGVKRLNVQSLANSPQWGQDNRIHVLAGGGNRGKVFSPKRPDLAAVELAGNDFWFDPRTLEFGLESGGAQYGMSFDDHGRRFGCSNSDHLQYWIHQDHSAGRNPHAPMPPARQSIAADGGAAEVFRISPDEPWRIMRTRWRVAGTVPGVVEGGGRVSGYFTGATGTTLYRGDVYGPSFLNNSFTGDAGGQLVHRKIIGAAADGVNLIGTRPADESGREFAASSDLWVRVVNFANAPDGCLYFADMYREVIEHPWSIPDEIKAHLDLSGGSDRGRIYRLVPDQGAPRIGQRFSYELASSAELTALLAHANGWHRDTGQRLLVERQDPAAVELLAGMLDGEHAAPTQLHVLGALEGLGRLDDPILLKALDHSEPAVRERGLLLVAKQKPSGSVVEKLVSMADDPSPRTRFQLALTVAALVESAPALEAALVRLAARDHSLSWTAAAVLSAPPDALSGLWDALAADAVFVRNAASFMARLLEIRAASAAEIERGALIDFVALHEADPVWLEALGEGLRRGGTSLGEADRRNRFAPIFETAAEIAADTRGEVAARLEAIKRLKFAPAPIRLPPLTACLAKGQPDAVQSAALSVLAAEPTPELARQVLDHWSGLGPASRERALAYLLSRDDQLLDLIDAVKAEKLPASAFSAAQVQALTGHSDPAVSLLAKEALAAVIPLSRAAVAEAFHEAIDLPGDAARGRAHFLQRCTACHRADGEGISVGPDLVTVKGKGRAALLADILDPHREVASRFILYTIRTTTGQTAAGMIDEDHSAAMTLLLPGGGKLSVPRQEIAGTSSDGHSLMPEGLEGGLSKQDMADLLTFIESLN